MFTPDAQVNIRCSRCGRLCCADIRLNPDGGTKVGEDIFTKAGLERATIIVKSSDKVLGPDIDRDYSASDRITGIFCQECSEEVRRTRELCADLIRLCVEKNVDMSGLVHEVVMAQGGIKK